MTHHAVNVSRPIFQDIVPVGEKEGTLGFSVWFQVNNKQTNINLDFNFTIRDGLQDFYFVINKRCRFVDA